MGKILFVISNQPDNLGDVIQNRNILTIFAQVGMVIVDDHYLEERHCASLGIHHSQLLSENIDLPNLRKVSGIFRLILSRHKPYDAVLRVPAAVQYRNDVRGLMYALVTLAMYILLYLKGIKIWQFGMTCDPSRLRGLLLTVERAKSKVHDIYGIRDIGAYEQLDQLSFSNLYYCPDVFYWDAPIALRHNALSRPDTSEGILLSFRKTIPDVSDESNYVRQLGKRISSIVASLPKETKITFSYQVPMDYEMNRFLYEQLKQRGNCDFMESCLDAQTAEALYRSSSVLISNRQHVLLYGAKLGVPMLALTDFRLHWKLLGALRDLGVPETLLADINDSDEDVVNKCQHILENREAISTILQSAVMKKGEEAIRFLTDRCQP